MAWVLNGSAPNLQDLPYSANAEDPFSCGPTAYEMTGTHDVDQLAIRQAAPRN